MFQPFQQQLMGRKVEALRLYNQGLLLLPQSGKLHCERGALFANLNQQDEAIQDLNKAIQSEPKNTHYLMMRAQIRAQKKQYSATDADFTSVIKLGAPTARIYGQRADMYKKMGREDLAAQDIQKANDISADMMGAK